MPRSLDSRNTSRWQGPKLSWGLFFFLWHTCVLLWQQRSLLLPDQEGDYIILSTMGYQNDQESSKLYYNKEQNWLSSKTKHWTRMYIPKAVLWKVQSVTPWLSPDFDQPI